jgi:hypothetical protein
MAHRKEAPQMSDDFAQEPVVEEPVETEALDTEAHEDEGAPDKWELLKAELGDDFDPQLVVKNVKQYTQTRQELAEERRSLEELRQIQDAFESDPDFAQHVLGYGKKRQEEMTAEELAREALHRVETQEANFQTQRALADLHSQLKDEGNPDFNDIELLSFAARNRIADLEAAYLKMYKGDLLKGREKAVIEQERSKKQAGVLTKVRDSGRKSSFTREDIAAMSPKELEQNYSKILESMKA